MAHKTDGNGQNTKEKSVPSKSVSLCAWEKEQGRVVRLLASGTIANKERGMCRATFCGKKHESQVVGKRKKRNTNRLDLSTESFPKTEDCVQPVPARSAGRTVHGWGKVSQEGGKNMKSLRGRGGETRSFRSTRKTSLRRATDG